MAEHLPRDLPEDLLPLIEKRSGRDRRSGKDRRGRRRGNRIDLAIRSIWGVLQDRRSGVDRRSGRDRRRSRT